MHPIGIGDTANTIIAKAVLSIAAPDIQDASGCLQLCSGQISGVEAAVHAIRSAFESEECEAALFVDATNALNTLNCQVALHNIRYLCPPIATILINSYRSRSRFSLMETLFYLEKALHKDTTWPCLCKVWQSSHSFKDWMDYVNRYGMLMTLLPRKLPGQE